MALQLWERRRFDAALLDALMPDMSGWELARELRRRAPEALLAMVTGMDVRGQNRANLALVDAVFRKPIDVGRARRLPLPVRAARPGARAGPADAAQLGRPGWPLKCPPWPTSWRAIRQKVEAGEALSDAEFSVLARHARAQGGPALRLTVAARAAQRGGDERQGLSLMERLARDFPRDVQVRLGHARALIGLERYADAERALKDALALNPGDPEAFKALAVVALRRGEVARARNFVAEVLRRDPFDGEARLLKAELEEVDPGGVPAEATALKSEFITALLKRLEAKGVAHLRHGRDVLVKLAGGGVARVDTGSLYAGYVEGGKSLAEAAEATAAELEVLAMGVPATREALLGAVLPVLRGPGFRESASGSVSREGPAGLMVYYVLDHPELVRYVPRMVLEAGRATLEELDAAAWENLGRKPGRLAPARVRGGLLGLAERPSGLWVLGTSDGHDAARLLWPAHRALLARELGGGPWRVHLGHRELALACREADAEAVAELESLRAAPNGIQGRFHLDAEGRLTALG